VFDPSRITAVGNLPYFKANARVASQGVFPEIAFPLPSRIASNTAKPKTMTQVLGVFATLMPVKETVDDVLKLVNKDQFIQLTLPSGDPIWMRASAIGWMMAKYPGLSDPNVGCYVSLSLQVGRPTGVKESVTTVQQLVEAARAK
jgi:hypothetical protein